MWYYSISVKLRNCNNTENPVGTAIPLQLAHHFGEKLKLEK